MFGVFAAAVPSPTPVPPPPGPPPGVVAVFEAGDGNAVDNSGEGPLPDDWNFVNPAAGAPPLTQVAGGGNAQVAVFINDTGANDQIFTQGGSKDFNDVQPDWMHTTGSVPDKDEITNAYAARYVVPTNSSTDCVTGNCTAGHQILVFGGDRFATNGDANIGFWFFQNPVSPIAAGAFSGFHLDGDIFVLSAFTGGGGTSTIRVLEWLGTALNANAAACTSKGLGAFVDPASDTGAFPNGSLCDITALSANPGASIVNSAPRVLDWPYTLKGAKTPCNNTPISGGTFGSGPGCTAPAGAFYEGGIDLTALNVPGTECFSTFMLETRSSASVDAVLKDFALGSFQQCGLSCSKVAAPATVCEGSSTTYTYTAGNPNSPVAIEVSLIDDNETPCTSPNNPVGCAADDIDVIASSGGPDVTVASEGGVAQTVVIQPNTTAGPYTRTKTLSLVGSPHTNQLTVHAVSQSGVPDCITTATVTVLPNPTVTVNSPTVCASALPATMTATPSPAGSYTYVWSGPFDGAHPNPGDVSSFSAFNAGLYSVTITDTATGANHNSCSGSGSGTLTVNPNPTVTVNSPEVCDGSSATITASPSGGNGTYHFAWTVPSGVTNPGDTASFSASVAGNYSVIVTDTSTTHCTGSGSGTLTLDANPTVSITGDETCSTDNSLTLTAAVTGGSGTITYTWTVPAGVADPGNSATAAATAPGNYAVHVTRGVANCPGDAHLHVGLCAGSSTPGPLPTPSP